MRAGRVLIVEDEPHIAEAILFLCEREGLKADVCPDGSDALARLTDYQLVILDIMLPGASGFEVAEAVRRLTAPPKVCVLTAKGQPNDRARMSRIGVNAFVTKPFSNKALMETVRALMATP